MKNRLLLTLLVTGACAQASSDERPMSRIPQFPTGSAPTPAPAPAPTPFYGGYSYGMPAYNSYNSYNPHDRKEHVCQKCLPFKSTPHKIAYYIDNKQYPMVSTFSTMPGWAQDMYLPVIDGVRGNTSVAGYIPLTAACTTGDVTLLKLLSKMPDFDISLKDYRPRYEQLDNVAMPKSTGNDIWLSTLQGEYELNGNVVFDGYNKNGFYDELIKQSKTFPSEDVFLILARERRGAVLKKLAAKFPKEMELAAHAVDPLGNNCLLVALDIYWKERFDRSPDQAFIKEAREAQIDTILFLINTPGVDINYKNPTSGWTPLMSAVAQRLIPVVEAILSHKNVDLDSTITKEGPFYGKSALQIAYFDRFMPKSNEIIRLLEAKKAEQEAERAAASTASTPQVEVVSAKAGHARAEGSAEEAPIAQMRRLALDGSDSKGDDSDSAVSIFSPAKLKLAPANEHEERLQLQAAIALSKALAEQEHDGDKRE